MKGFVITPIVFIGAAFVVAFLLFSYFSLNARAVSAIDTESAFAKLRANALEMRVDVDNMLYKFALESASSDCMTIENYVQSKMSEAGKNGSVEVTVGSGSYLISYIGEYSGTIGSASLDENITVVRQIGGTCA